MHGDSQIHWGFLLGVLAGWDGPQPGGYVAASQSGGG